MKKKVCLFFALLCMTMCLSGCTTYLKDDKNQVIKEATTGQSLVSNILCQPTDKNVIKTYEKNGVDIESLPKCSEFTPAAGKYNGIWEALFVKPLSFIIINIGKILGNYGLSIIIVTIIIRLIILPISKKSAMQSEGLKLAQKDLEKLEVKYRNRVSQEDQMLKAQEMMGIYKKYNINPASGCLFAFIQLPLFLVFLESLNRLPIVFEGTFLGFKLGTTPFTALFGESFNLSNFASSFSNGNWIYLILPILVALTTIFSFKFNSGASGSEEQQKAMKLTMNIMIVFIVFASFGMSTSINIYWIVGSLFTIIQMAIVRRSKNGDNKKRSKKAR